MSWRIAKKLVRQETSPFTEGTSLSGADPELCVTLLHRGLNFSGLKGRLRSADQQWMEAFLEHGGLSAIFDAMEALGSRGFSSMSDALRQLDCVACVKAVMNSTFGLDFIIHYPEKKYVRKLSEGELTRLLVLQVYISCRVFLFKSSTQTTAWSKCRCSNCSAPSQSTRKRVMH